MVVRGIARRESGRERGRAVSTGRLPTRREQGEERAAAFGERWVDSRLEARGERGGRAWCTGRAKAYTGPDAGATRASEHNAGCTVPLCTHCTVLNRCWGLDRSQTMQTLPLYRTIVPLLHSPPVGYTPTREFAPPRRGAPHRHICYGMQWCCTCTDRRIPRPTARGRPTRTRVLGREFTASRYCASCGAPSRSAAPRCTGRTPPPPRGMHTHTPRNHR